MKVTGFLKVKPDRVVESKYGQTDPCMKATGWRTRPTEKVD